MGEMEVLKLFGTKIKIVDTDNHVWVGIMNFFEGSNDNENGLFSVGLELEGEENGVEIYENEIKSIEAIN